MRKITRHLETFAVTECSYRCFYIIILFVHDVIIGRKKSRLTAARPVHRVITIVDLRKK